MVAVSEFLKTHDLPQDTIYEDVPFQTLLMIKELIEANVVMGETVTDFVSYLESKFKINRYKATVLACTLIASVKEQIEENQETAKDIQEVANDLPVSQ